MLRLISLFSAFLFIYTLEAQVRPQEAIVSLQANNITLSEAIHDLSLRYNISFYYSSSKIEVHKNVLLNVDRKPLPELLDLLKQQADFSYKISDKGVILYPPASVSENTKMVAVHGFVQDSLSGERLIGANIIFPEINKGTTTNAYGYFSYALPEGKYLFRCSYIGYPTVDTTIEISGNQPIVLHLKPGITTLKEVKLVNKPNDKITSARNGYDMVPMKMLRSFPTLLGEKDVIQFLKLMPGIRSCNEGSNGLYIRGTTQNQTTFLIDDAPMFNMYHISGMFSTINPDAIKDLSIYKSHLPVKTGGALSSIVDIRLRDGNNQHFAVTGGMGTVSAKLTLEGPIVKNKASFILSARRSHIDKFLNLLKGTQDVTFHFYDIHSKLNYTLNSRNRIFVSGYLGKDYFQSDGGTTWGNSLLSLRWNRVINQNLFSNFILTGSEYHHSFFGESADETIKITTRLKNYAAKYDFTLTTLNNQKIYFGINSSYAEMLPVEVQSQNPESLSLLSSAGNQQRFIHQVYANAILDVGMHWGIDAGARVSLLQNMASLSKTVMVKPEPLISVKYQFTTQSSVKWAYSRNYQFHHGASIFEMIIPFDRYILADSELPPQYADHVSFGYFFRNKKDWFELSVETYYSRIHNQYRFKLGDQFFLEKDYYDLAIPGKANAYGLEVSLRKQTGRLNGMLSYTLSKVNRKEQDVNYNKQYSPYYDRRHDFSLSLGFDLSQRINLSGSWVFMTGNPYNLPVGKYELRGRTIPLFSNEGLYNKRMPLYHRLDAGCQIKIGKGKRFKQTLSFNVYNIYLQNNPVFYYYRDVADKDLTKDIQTAKYTTRNFSMISQYIFKFVPSFSYEFKFE